MAETAQQIMQRVANAPRNEKRLNTGDFEFSASVPGERSVFAEFQANVPYSIRPGVPLDLAIPAYQRETADGDGNESTYQLGHSLADDPAMANDLVLFADGTQVSPDSMSYANNEFSYTDDGTAQELDVFYLSDEQAELTLRINAPRNHWNEPINTEIGLHHTRDTNDDPVTFSPEKTALDGIAPTDYTLEWSINAPYEVRRTVDSTGATARNMLISLPVWKANNQIRGLKDLKSASIR